MPGESCLHVFCHCGHTGSFWIADMPEGVTDSHGNVTPVTLSRLKCKACGRVGRPKEIRLGWGHRSQTAAGQLGAPGRG